MKLVVAIVNNDDSHAVLSEITRAEFSATKLSTLPAASWRAGTSRS